MGKTAAEELLEHGESIGILKGALAKQRESLLSQLRLKFKRVPKAVVAEIEACQDEQQLDGWLAAFATADKLSDIPFQNARA
jgi:hypothetical protein